MNIDTQRYMKSIEDPTDMEMNQIHIQLQRETYVVMGMHSSTQTCQLSSHSRGHT